MIHLIYASVATRECGMAQLAEILEKSREKNKRLGLSGILLHSKGSFLQVLEGKPEVVDRLYEQLLRDNRHTQLTLIIREPIPRRFFASWTMGFSDLSAQSMPNTNGINDFFQSGSCFTKLDAGRAKKLLAAFTKGRWREKLADPLLQEAGA